MEKNSCLIIFETAMNKRYIQMAKLHGHESYCVNLDNNLDNNVRRNFLKRLRSKKILQREVEKLVTYLKLNKYEYIYLSSAEGYVSKNIIYKLKKNFSKHNFIGIQHGLFPLHHNTFNTLFRALINNLFFIFYGIFPFGSGFGSIKLNKYYVYSEREKNFLVQKKNWNIENVIVDIKFIKAELYYESLKNVEEQEDDTAIFLLQGLHRAGLCSEKNENHLISKTIDYLSKRYKKILLKEHPSCQGRLNNKELPENVEVIDSILEGFKKSKNAYSFFSTSLIDAKVFNIKTVGIISNSLKVDEEIYENFDLKLHFENTIDR